MCYKGNICYRENVEMLQQRKGVLIQTWFRKPKKCLWMLRGYSNIIIYAQSKKKFLLFCLVFFDPQILNLKFVLSVIFCTHQNIMAINLIFILSGNYISTLHKVYRTRLIVSGSTTARKARNVEELTRCVRMAEPLVNNPEYVLPLTKQEIQNVCRCVLKLFSPNGDSKCLQVCF